MADDGAKRLKIENKYSMELKWTATLPVDAWKSATHAFVADA
jgi:hypothetical protein